MKKKILSLISLSALLAITGCSQEVKKYREVPVIGKYNPTSLYVENPGVVLFTGETQQISTRIKPVAAHDADLVYKSSNKNVATVSETGLIKAKGAGRAVITVSSKNNPEICDQVVVGVEENSISGKEGSTELDNSRYSVTKKLKKQLDIQKSVYDVKTSGSQITGDYKIESNLEKVYVKMCYVSSRTRDGVPMNWSYTREDFLVSKPDGFFFLDEHGLSSRTTNGDPSYEFEQFYMFCNEDFDAHAYRGSDTFRRRAEINAQDYIGKVDRIEIVMMMLDNIFTSQRKIITNQFDACLETNELDASSAIKGGATDGGKKSAGIRNYTSSNKYTIKASEETDVDIPAGTVCTMTDITSFHWTKGIVDCSIVNETLEYKLKDPDGSEHDYVYAFTRYLSTAINDNVEVSYPESGDYEKVDNFISLF